MDTLHFERKIVLDPYSDKNMVCAITTINNQSLLEIVRKYEFPYPPKDDPNNIADAYEYQFAYELHNELSDKKYRINDDEVTLLICRGCFEEGCWPFIVKLKELDDCIIWKDFHNPHRLVDSISGFWDFSNFGTFCFDKTAYRKEVEKLKSFSHE